VRARRRHIVPRSMRALRWEGKTAGEVWLSATLHQVYSECDKPCVSGEAAPARRVARREQPSVEKAVCIDYTPAPELDPFPTDRTVPDSDRVGGVR
jgi:hypothetical protein